MKPELLIFDIDGTILDSMHIWHTSANLYLESIGIYEEKDLSTMLFTATIETASHYLKKNYPIKFSEPEIQKGILDLVRKYYATELQLRSGVKEILDWCKNEGYKMVVATSGEQELFSLAFKRLDLEKYFDAYYSRVNKNFPESFEKIASENGVKPENILIFEDALHASLSAKKAGLNVAAIMDKESLGNWEELKKIADYSFEEWENFDKAILK